MTTSKFENLKTLHDIFTPKRSQLNSGKLIFNILNSIKTFHFETIGHLSETVYTYSISCLLNL